MQSTDYAPTLPHPSSTCSPGQKRPVGCIPIEGFQLFSRAARKPEEERRMMSSTGRKAQRSRLERQRTANPSRPPPGVAVFQSTSSKLSIPFWVLEIRDVPYQGCRVVVLRSCRVDPLTKDPVRNPITVLSRRAIFNPGTPCRHEPLAQVGIPGI